MRCSRQVLLLASLLAVSAASPIDGAETVRVHEQSTPEWMSLASVAALFGFGRGALPGKSTTARTLHPKTQDAFEKQEARQRFKSNVRVIRDELEGRGGDWTAWEGCMHGKVQSDWPTESPTAKAKAKPGPPRTGADTKPVTPEEADRQVLAFLYGDLSKEDTAVMDRFQGDCIAEVSPAGASTTAAARRKKQVQQQEEEYRTEEQRRRAEENDLKFDEEEAWLRAGGGAGTGTGTDDARPDERQTQRGGGLDVKGEVEAMVEGFKKHPSSGRRIRLRMPR